MNKEKGIPSKNAHRHGYPHQDEALLFQFVLHEFLSSSRAMQEPLSLQLFQKLIGDYFQFQTPYLLSYRQSGFLLKLNHYLLLLSIHFPKRNCFDDHLFKEIFQSTEKAINAAIESQRCFEKNGPNFNLSFKRLQRQMKKLAQLLPKRISCYKQNENVLYFLLRRKADFDLLYSPKMLSWIFQSLFKGGMEEGVAWIVEQYKQRKFNHLLPRILQQIECITK